MLVRNGQRLRVIAGLALMAFAIPSAARSENWPGWRGPRGDGTSQEESVPTRWDAETGDNIAWRVESLGEGHSSPVIWGERLLLTACVPDKAERILVCLDRRTGTTIWQKTVLTSPLETKHSLNSFASSTPATDGKSIYVTFLQVDGSTIPARNVGTPRPVTPGTMVVAAYDMDGNERWIARPGEFVSVHGFCSCPVLHKNLVIVNGDHDGDSYLVALNKETGETAWKVGREHKTRSYATPIIRQVAGKTQMVLSGNKSICSYDPETGDRHWNIEGPTEQFVASPVFDGKLFFMAAGFPDYHVMGIRPDGSGDVTGTHVAWHDRKANCYVPSPVVADGFLLVADDAGTGNCYDAATGKTMWVKRMGKHYSASLVTAGGVVYFLADDGVTKVVKPGASLDVVAENPLGENCYASPAISQGQIFIRGEKHLFAIGKPVQ